MTTSSPWHVTRVTNGCEVAPQSRGGGDDRCDVGHAGASWRARERAMESTRAGRCVVGEAHRAITDDDLLRFFTVYETAGMLG